jgi:hypothetical protein
MINETYPITIHKIMDDELILEPGEKRVVKFIVFPKRLGTHRLWCFKVYDRQLVNNAEHMKKGYVYSSPKYTIEE